MCKKHLLSGRHSLWRSDHAATARIRNRWMKFRELLPINDKQSSPVEMKGRVYASCVRSSIIYGSETSPLLASVGLSLK